MSRSVVEAANIRVKEVALEGCPHTSQTPPPEHTHAGGGIGLTTRFLVSPGMGSMVAILS